MNYFSGIDYDNLQKLCNISGLQNRDNSKSTPEAHKEFLQQYRNIFIQPKAVLPKIPELASTLNKRSNRNVSAKDDNHLKKLQSKQDGVPHHFQEQIKILTGILSKLPYYRTRSEHLIIYKILSLFPAIKTQFTDPELKELSGRIIMESWDRGCIVFGYQAFYMILKGCAKPYEMLGNTVNSKDLHPWLDPPIKLLSFGDSFGSLIPIPNDASHKVLSVLTKANCELVKISIGQYENVKKEILAHNNALKEELVQACPFYQQWPKLSLHKLIELIKWKKFPKDYELDSVIQMLLQHTAEPILGNLTQEEINNRYVFLEKEKKWRKFKEKVIKETILYRGIKFDVGKWNQSWSRNERSKAKLCPSFKSITRLK
ncbi:cyclic nucleotide-binding domain-containing protein 1 isoform X4 [Hypanus sabinus]|uniref:cyclic nucleotide-binding domain-containing protein 1 isoform X4 n=1 Tax=Hypanus sabinus TaxID=79690 RepID=UPI0028C488B5|nr:cyclic nucleotide-binding domain-containing protein 1 isoform X4 [Hypanus sabinus]